jgi:SAM-dependent methyltransferase
MFACNVCNSFSIDLFSEQNPSNLYRCRECGLIFFYPLPSKELLDYYYSSEEGYLPSIRDTMRVYHENRINRDAHYQGILGRMMRNTHDPKNILDIGCGYGFFLLYCKEQGLEPFGVEISRQTSSWAREQGMNVFTGTLQEASYENESFDVITSFHQLEHTVDPKAEVTKIYSLLKKAGIFYLALPNAFSLVAEDSFATWKWKSWPNHLFYFSPQNLRVLLVRVGFQIIDIFSQVGDSEINDDRRVLEKNLSLEPQDRDDVLKLLYGLNKGQELIIISKKI